MAPRVPLELTAQQGLRVRPETRALQDPRDLKELQDPLALQVLPGASAQPVPLEHRSLVLQVLRARSGIQVPPVPLAPRDRSVLPVPRGPLSQVPPARPGAQVLQALRASPGLKAPQVLKASRGRPALPVALGRRVLLDRSVPRAPQDQPAPQALKASLDPRGPQAAQDRRAPPGRLEALGPPGRQDPQEHQSPGPRALQGRRDRSGPRALSRLGPRIPTPRISTSRT